ncbi:MAG: hypothetical protein NXI13_04805 [Proteobacteria bacterium]|nr:hypothetical protein [Pseudomonadota bacterium]
MIRYYNQRVTGSLVEHEEPMENRFGTAGIARPGTFFPHILTDLLAAGSR